MSTGVEAEHGLPKEITRVLLCPLLYSFGLAAENANATTLDDEVVVHTLGLVTKLVGRSLSARGADCHYQPWTATLQAFK